MTKELINLGWMNGWNSTPRIVEECYIDRTQFNEKHDIVYDKHNYRGRETVTCHTCGYTYQVDTT